MALRMSSSADCRFYPCSVVVGVSEKSQIATSVSWKVIVMFRWLIDRIDVLCWVSEGVDR